MFKKLEGELEKLARMQNQARVLMNTASPEVALNPGDIGLAALPDEVLW